MKFRTEQFFVACGLSVVGLSIAARRLLANRASRLSRFVDDHILPYGVTR